MPRARKVRDVDFLHPDGWREVHIVWRLPEGRYKARLSLLNRQPGRWRGSRAPSGGYGLANVRTYFTRSAICAGVKSPAKPSMLGFLPLAMTCAIWASVSFAPRLSSGP